MQFIGTAKNTQRQFSPNRKRMNLARPKPRDNKLELSIFRGRKGATTIDFRVNLLFYKQINSIYELV